MVDLLRCLNVWPAQDYPGVIVHGPWMMLLLMVLIVLQVVHVEVVVLRFGLMMIMGLLAVRLAVLRKVHERPVRLADGVFRQHNWLMICWNRWMFRLLVVGVSC